MPPPRAVPPPLPGDALVAASVAPGGDLVTLWAAPADRARLRDRSRRPRPVAARVVFDGPAARRRLDVEVGVRLPTAHGLPDGGALVIGALAGADGPERNALRFDADGRRVAATCVGDGVGCAATTASGALWVGYTDEGVFGSRGWDRPIGAPGVRRFDAALAPVDVDVGVDLADCYALAVDGEDALVCPYPDWPLLRLGARRGAWRGAPDGASILLVEGDRVAFVGGYAEARDRVVVARLGAGRLEDVRVGAIDLGAADAVVGRGGALHVIGGGAWRTLDLDDLELAVLGV